MRATPRRIAIFVSAAVLTGVAIACLTYTLTFVAEFINNVVTTQGWIS